jgi:hypothetical protein
MTKKLITLFCVMIAACSYAQTEKGTFAIGGAFGYGSSDNEYATYETKVVSLSASPTIGYFFKNGFVAGIVASYSKTKTTEQDVVIDARVTGIGPNLRYYVKFKQLAVFPTVTLIFGKEKGSHSSASSSWEVNETKVTTFRGGVGLTYFFNRNVGLEGQLLYQSENPANPSFTYQTISSSSLVVSLGFQVYLHRKTEK